MDQVSGFTYSLGEIAAITGGKVAGDSNVVINRVLTDSRSLNMPGETLFVAIKGANHDGHNYITDLYNKGVMNFLVTCIVRRPAMFPHANFICVSDSLKALQSLAAYFRSRFKYPVTGITGSNGKTVVKEWLADMLGGYKHFVRSPKSFNSQLGVPLSVLQMNSGHELAIFEAGISFPGEMTNLQEILKPEIGIFTNIGPAHQENFEDTRHKVTEKLKLFSDSRLLIYCSDYNLLHQQINQYFKGKNIRLVSWSSDNSGVVKVSYKPESETKTEIIVVFENKNYTFDIPFGDKASRENAVNCAVWWLAMGFDFDIFASRTQKLESVSMRLEVKEGINNTVIINDSFNSDLYSLRIAMDTLNHHARNRKKIVILSDILQSGYNQDILYGEVAEIMNRNEVGFFAGIGGGISAYWEKFNMPSVFYSNVENLLNNLHALPFSNAAVLLKGARVFHFEQIMKRMEKKVHETVFEVNLNAVAHNLKFYKSLLPENTKMMVMVKAFSYGSGMLEIANLLQFNRVDYLAVAFADEGVELRRNGISLPIMVMNPDVYSFDTIVEYNLEPELYGLRTFDAFTALVARNGLTAFPVHLKIDTGMHRLGFTRSDLPDLLERLKKNPAVRIASVFSHLAASEDSAEDEFTRGQIKLFNEICNEIGSVAGKAFLKHIANTSGIERVPEAKVMDMVRLGIGLYGFSENYEKQLEPAGCLRTIISQIRSLKKGDTVGYNRRGKAERDITVATIPVGYADGMYRSLGNGKASFWLKGKKVPTIGNICMDMCMLDITEMDAQEGDEVILFRSSRDVNELARAAGTIPYEILVHISQRVKRIYLQE